MFGTESYVTDQCKVFYEIEDGEIKYREISGRNNRVKTQSKVYQTPHFF